MFNIGPLELMIVLMVALIIVGPKRLPEIGRTIGKAFSELRRVQDEVRDTIRFDLDDDKPYSPPPRSAHRDRDPEKEPPSPTTADVSPPGREEPDVSGSEEGRERSAGELPTGESPSTGPPTTEGRSEAESPRTPARAPAETSNGSKLPAPDEAE